MHRKLAQVTLDLLTQARISVDDQSLLVARQVRAWLKGITTGALIVSEGPKPKTDGAQEQPREE